MALVHQSEMEQCLLVAAGMLMNYSLMGSLVDVSQSINWKCSHYIYIYIYIYTEIVLQFIEYYFNKHIAFLTKKVEPQMTAKEMSTVLG